MKQYITDAIQKNRTISTLIMLTGFLVPSVILLDFQAQGLHTKLEPTRCVGDWAVVSISPEKKSHNRKSIDNKPELKEPEAKSENDTPTVDDMLSVLDAIVADTPTLLFTTDTAGSETCSGFVTSELPEKALPRNLVVVMTISSSGDTDSDVSPSETVEDVHTSEDTDVNESNAVLPPSDADIESTISDILSDEPDADQDSAETVPEGSIDDSQVPPNDEAAPESSSESAAEPTVFLVHYAFAQETVDEPESASEPEPEPFVEETFSPTEENPVEVTGDETTIVESTETEPEPESVVEETFLPTEEVLIEITDDKSDSTETADTELETGSSENEQAVVSNEVPAEADSLTIEVSFDDGDTWNTAGVIGLDTVPKNPTDISVSVPITDPLFWMHVDQLQMRITRLVSSDSSDTKINIEHPHFVLEYDDTAAMPDFSMNKVIDIKSMDDLTVFVLDHNETRERTLWTFQSTGSSQWTQVSEVSGISSDVPIVLKSIYMFWVTADNNSVQGFDISSRTIFGTTIDHNKAQLPFGSSGEVVVYRNNQLSFQQGIEAATVASDNDLTLVDLFIKDYVDFSREMQATLEEAVNLEPQKNDRTDSIINRNEILEMITDSLELITDTVITEDTPIIETPEEATNTEQPDPVVENTEPVFEETPALESSTVEEDAVIEDSEPVSSEPPLSEPSDTINESL